MKIRNDFVSNSSSCSFIIHVRNDDDVKQLTKPEVLSVLKKNYAYSSPDFFRRLTFPILDINSIIKDTFITVDIGDDSVIWNMTNGDIYGALCDTRDSLNIGYNNLQIYEDEWAHYTLGDEYKGQ